MNWIGGAIRSGWDVMWAAWPEFFAAVLAAGLVIWFLLRLRYQATIDRQKAEISYLKSKGTGGDEGPRLTDAQRRKIATVSPGAGPRELSVSCVVGYAQGERYVLDIASAFDEAGWETAYGQSIDEFEQVDVGLVLYVVDEKTLSAPEDAVRRALRDAKLRFEVMGGSKYPDVRILVKRPRE